MIISSQNWFGWTISSIFLKCLKDYSLKSSLDIYLMALNFFNSNGASFNTPNIVTLSIYFFCHKSCHSIFNTSISFCLCSHYIQQSKIFTRQIAVSRKIKIRAIVFWATLRILFFVQQLIKLTFNIQSTKHYCMCFCFTSLSKYLL